MRNYDAARREGKHVRTERQKILGRKGSNKDHPENQKRLGLKLKQSTSD